MTLVLGTVGKGMFLSREHLLSPASPPGKAGNLVKFPTPPVSVSASLHMVFDSSFEDDLWGCAQHRLGCFSLAIGSQRHQTCALIISTILGSF